MPGCACWAPGLRNEPDTDLLSERLSSCWETKHKQIIAPQCDAWGDREPQGECHREVSFLAFSWNICSNSGRGGNESEGLKGWLGVSHWEERTGCAKAWKCSCAWQTWEAVRSWSMGLNWVFLMPTLRGHWVGSRRNSITFILHKKSGSER